MKHRAVNTFPIICRNKKRGRRSYKKTYSYTPFAERLTQKARLLYRKIHTPKEPIWIPVASEFRAGIHSLIPLRNTTTTIALLFLLVVWNVSLVYAGATITGKVYNKKNGAIANVAVMAYAGESTLLTVTDTTGKFFISFSPNSVSERAAPPKLFSLSPNFPNPFNPRTYIQYTLPQPAYVTLSVFDVLGRKVAAIFEGKESAGTYERLIELDGCANGVYFAVFTAKSDGGYEYTQVRRMMLLYGSQHASARSIPYLHSPATVFAPSHNVTIDSLVFTGNISRTVLANLNVADSLDIGVVVVNEGPKKIRNIPPVILNEWKHDSLLIILSQYFGNDDGNMSYTVNNPAITISGDTAKWKPVHSDVSLSNVVFTATDSADANLTATSNAFNVTFNRGNLITGFVYDLATKNSGAQGIPNMKVYLGSDPSQSTLTDANGNFTLVVGKTGNDLIFVVGKTAADTAYYFWHRTVNITANTNLTAFNDPSGIPLFKRYVDSNGEDLLDFVKKITDVAIRTFEFMGLPEYNQTIPRFKDGQNVKVFLNRAVAPNSWYADSSWAGLKQMENESLKFTEVGDSASANLVLKYNYSGTGQNQDKIYDKDAQGPYLRQVTINIRGPPNGTLEKEIVSYIVAHEFEHAIFTTGLHSPFVTDEIFGDVYFRYYNSNIKDFESPKEKKASTIIYTLERNPKLLDYFK